MPFDTISSSATFTTVERGQFVNVLPDAGSISRVTVTPPSGPVRQFDMQPGQLYTFGALDALTSVAVTLFAGTAKVDTDIPADVSSGTFDVPTPNGSDDTAILSAAMALTGRVYLRAGTYLVTSQITWPSNAVLVGHPDGTTIKAKDATNLAWMFAISGATSNIGAEGVTFDANTSGQSSGNNGLLDFASGTPTTTRWDRCTFTGTKVNGMSFKGSDHEFKFCRWTAVRTAIVLTDGATNVLFSVCRFDAYNNAASNAPCVSLIGTSNLRHIRFVSCIWNNTSSSTHFSVEAVSPGSDEYAEIHMGDCELNALTFGGTGVSGTFQNSTFVGNRWLNGRGSNRAGFEITGSGNRFEGNYFEATNSSGLAAGAMCCFTGGGSGAWSSIRRGNAFVGNTVKVTSTSDTALGGIYLRDHSDLLISGNTIDIDVSGTATVQSAIYVGTFGTAGALRNVTISNNTIRCNSASGNGIRLLTSAGSNETAGTNYGKNIRIQGNKIVGFSAGLGLPNTANDTDIHIIDNEILTASTRVSGAIFGDGCIVANTVAAESDPYDGAISTKTGTYTATVLDRVINASTGSGFTITLMAYPYKGQLLTIKRVTTEGNTLTIAANDSPIDGSLTSLTDTATNRPSFHFRGNRRSQTFTVTIATPGVVTANAHGYIDNQVVYLATSGALPTGLTAGTKYFVRNSAANTFELSTTSGGASIATSGTQSGTHTVTTAEWIRI